MDLYLDIGSTNMKWQFGDGEIGHRPFVKNKTEAAPYCEIDLKEILRAVYGILAIQRFDRLFLSVQMHGYVLLDENGSELTDYISWKDRRASLVSIPFTMHSENGVELKDNLPRAGVYAISRLKPELYRSIREFCTFGSYLCRKLTGVNATHITDAAPSGFFNVRTCLGRAEFVLPKACREVGPVGYYRGAQVFTPVGDQQAAVYGIAENKGAYILNLGTTGQMCCLCEQSCEGPFESRPFFGTGSLCTVSGLPAGEALAGNGPQDKEILQAYRNALARLPARRSLIVVGGAASFYRRRLQGILSQLALPFIFSEGESALKGLKLLAKQCEEASVS